MRTKAFLLAPLTVLPAGAAISACSSWQPAVSPVLPTAAKQRIVFRTGSGYQYQTIYRFQGYNGAAPEGNLIYFKGKFYGTTRYGGYYSLGTVYSLTPDGVETVLHSFGEGSDGSEPEAGLTVLNGVLYGTTLKGGTSAGGTLFSITVRGVERVLHSFDQPYSDGEDPMGGLTPSSGALYGTTAFGGENGAGVVFVANPQGQVRVLHHFKPYTKSDGVSPESGLILNGGKFYGTTYSGGECGEGTVFSITTAGTEHILYSFNCTRYDGYNPQADLLAYDGKLFGTTTAGGPHDYNSGGVFRITTSGKGGSIFYFTPTGYGFGSRGALIRLGRTLYGTNADDAELRHGSLYAITTGGTGSVVHTFGEAPDGANPLSGLIEVGGAFYGTTSAEGGVADCGTVYKLVVGSGAATNPYGVAIR